VRRALLVLALAALATTPGCLDLTPARVPDRLLEGAGGNGWERNLTASQAQPSGSLTEKTQTLVYDHTSGPGYQGQVAVTTLRKLFRPSEDALRQSLADQMRARANAAGIALSGAPAEGTREIGNRAQAYWFAYDGTASTGGFFSTNAEVKIYGEVFQCPTSKTEVATIGLAQVTNVRTVGGVALPSDADPTTWDDIVEDPSGTLGAVGSEGLAYNVAC
jgi:hypothetical protein